MNYSQILRDINRSYPKYLYFAKGGLGQKEMENVLIAYSKYDPRIGYVQGMNFIAGALLYHCPEEIAFWIFVSLMDYYKIKELYSPGLPGLYKYSYIIDSLISENLPDLSQHLVIVIIS